MGRIKKRGIFFTFISIIIITTFIFIFVPQVDVSLQKDNQATMTRIRSIDDYVGDLENNYLKTILSLVNQKTILSMIYYMNETNSYIVNLDSAYYEIMLNGTIDGKPIDKLTKKKIMGDNTLVNWTNKIINASKEALKVETNVTIINITVNQTDPRNIDTSLFVNITIVSNVARWNRNMIINTSNSIEGFYDPYYLVNTKGLYANKIKKSDVPLREWTPDKLRVHIKDGTYVSWEDKLAPSFLMRFTNTITSSSCCGIESVLDPNKLAQHGQNHDQIESYVDYLFWSHKFANNCTQLYNITGLWDEFKYFKLDFEHLTRYNITSQDAVKTC